MAFSTRSDLDRSLGGWVVVGRWGRVLSSGFEMGAGGSEGGRVMLLAARGAACVWVCRVLTARRLSCRSVFAA